MLAQRLWDAIKDIGAILWPARFSIGVVIIALPFLLALGPSQDALLAAVAQQHSLASKLLLAAVCLLWALETFYWAYFMSRLPPPPKGARADPGHPWLSAGELEALNNAFPFWLGLAALTIAGVAILRANWESLESRWLIASAWVIAAALYAIFTRRFGTDRLTPLMYLLLRVPVVNRAGPLMDLHAAHGVHIHRDLFPLPEAPRGNPVCAPLAGRIITSRSLGCRIALVVMVVLTFAVYWQFGAEHVETRQWIAALVSLTWLLVGSACVLSLTTQDMRPLTKLWVLLNFALFTAIFIASLYAASFLNGWFPSLVSSPLVMFSAFCAWVFFGTFFFALPAELFRLPVTTGILVLALLVSLVPGDNHDIRLADGATPSIELSKAFAQWHKAAEKVWKGQGPTPLIIVATAGGASRAGYWTAKVLGELEDAHPGFHNYVFAISSVSGGTVGAGLWRAMLDNEPCKRGHSYVNCARLFFCQDFLGPMFLGGLYADLTQRILPGRLLPDRATALEQSWEVAWANMMEDPKADNLMRLGFHQLKQSDDKNWFPLLLINGTSEKTGRRIITSTLSIHKFGVPELDNPSDPTAVKKPFPDAVGFFDEIHTELSLSTALHNSARFTYLDAAGNIVTKRGNKKERNDRILDGGYFENFGADTAFDLLQALRALPHADNQFMPIVIQISSDPTLQEGAQRDEDWRNRLSIAVRGAPDATAPVITLYQARDAHGIRATTLDKNSASAEDYVHFRLTDPRITMSWAMSGFAIGAIDDQWAQRTETQGTKTQSAVDQAARDKLDQILWLGSPTPVSSAPSPRCSGGS